jgi:hypothetical protein
MGISESKRQRRLAKKKKKRKMKKSAAVSVSAVGGSSNALRLAKRSAILPIHECLVPEGLFDQTGIGTIVISRKMSSADFAISVILLDVYCLGVKNAYFRVLSLTEYRELLYQIGMNETLKSVEPACARKLVEECIEYASAIGFQPHSDYEAAKYIFGDIEVDSCVESYEFGKDGKPFYIVGPHDDATKVRRILKTLQENCGEGNYEYLMGVEAL